MKFWTASRLPKSQHELTSEMSSPYGEITATLDWCEENLFSPIFFIAEFFNTISNLAMMGLGIYGAFRSFKQGLEFRTIFSYLSLALVGIGSAAFHGTLLYSAQLLDEIPMLVTIAIYLYCALPKSIRQDQLKNSFSIIILVTYVVGVSLIYINNRNSVFFETAYGLGVAILFVYCFYWVRKYSLSKKHQTLKRVVIFSALSYLGAFFLWNIDNLFCDDLRTIRNTVGPVLAPLFQLHAWWHIGTSVGTYLAGVFLSFEDSDDLEKQGRVLGTNWFGLPIVELKGYIKQT